MIKLIAIDIDGTLLNDNNQISEHNRNAILKAKEKGVKIVIASGRQSKGVQWILDLLDLKQDDQYTINYNGAKIFNNGTGEVIYQSFISGKDVKELYKTSLKLGTFINIYNKNDELLTPLENKFTILEAYLNDAKFSVVDFNEFDDNEEFIKTMIVDDKDILNDLEPIFFQKYHNELSVLRSHPNFLEILNRDSNKGKAIETLALYLGINLDQILAFGDNGNDISMIKKAGYGYMMANAKDEYKDKAKYIAPSNNNSGVGVIIEEMIRRGMI